MALRLGFVLHVIAAAAEALDGGVGVAGDAPVGADHALIVVFPPEQILDDVFAVGVANVFPILGVQPPGNGVVGHHGGGGLGASVQLEGCLGEGLHMLGGVAAGIHRVLTEGVVGIPSCLAAAPAGPVLDHGVDALLAPAAGGFGGLHAVAVGFDHLLAGLRVHAQGVDEPHPPGLGAQVDLGAQGGADAQGPVLPGGILRKLPHHLRVEAGGEAHALRPFAHIPASRAELHRGGAPCPVPGVGGNVHGDAIGEGLRCFLQLVAPPGSGGGVLHSRHQHMADVFLLQKLPLLVGQRISLTAGFIKGLPAVGSHKGHLVPGHRLVGGVEHQPCDFLHAEPGGQILGPAPIVQPPVLIGEQLPGFRQVLKVQPVLLNQADSAVLAPAQLLVAWLGQTQNAGGFVFHFVRRLSGRYFE